MKTSRRVALLTVTLLAAVSTAHAQGQRGNRMDPARMLDKRISNLTSALDLDESQVESLRPILSTQMDAMMALREQMRETDADRASLRTRMQAIHASTSQQLRGILTDSQFQAWEEHVKANRGKHGRRGGGHRGRRHNRG